eukprot:NODE_1919_length_810_cov_48.528252_g1518_i0.p1 GENE.NODE_1919_length_810_cov_48.528252_g1518_i0~~NODE_1919_length_810_cov_48.528252_g1518_i0.p1  ORF type:complete len:222 (-),score=33.46 NODE_1919_length_810_cov_48.528252_g1518_i0:80-745(-)
MLKREREEGNESRPKPKKKRPKPQPLVPPVQPKPEENVLLKEAFTYLNTVRDTFAENNETYQEFTALLKDFKEKRVEIEYVVGRVKVLFRAHPELLVGFKAFLPEVSGKHEAVFAPKPEPIPDVDHGPWPPGLHVGGYPVDPVPISDGPLKMLPLGLQPHAHPPTNPTTCVDLTSHAFYNTYITYGLLRQLHINALPNSPTDCTNETSLVTLGGYSLHRLV